VLIWNRTRERAVEVAAQLKEEGFAAEPADDLNGAVRVADVITTCTRSHEPVIRGGQLKAGAHLDLVGGYTPGMREADDEAVRRSRVFVDRRESAFDGVGDILAPIASGVIGEADVLGDLYDLVPGAVPGRRTASDITFFKNAGGGHLDLMTAEVIYRRALMEKTK
jgi:ornithine cyclodeaminase